MVVKKKTKTRPASRDLVAAFKRVGVEYTGKGQVTTKIAGEMADSIAAQLEKGFNAQQTLNSRSAPADVNAELREMGIEPSKVHATIEEFRADVKGFCIAESVDTAHVKSIWGHALDLVRGEHYCMTSNLYISMNQGVRTLKPSGRKFTEIYTPYFGEALDMKTLFVWREGGVGDLIFIRPILMHLKKLYPTCKIIFATKQELHCMTKLWGDCIDDLEPVPFSCKRTFDKADYHLTFMGVIERIKQAEEIDVHDLFAQYSGLDPADIEWTCPMPTTSKNIWFQTAPPVYAVIQPHASSPTRTPHTRTIVAAINAITSHGVPCVVADRKQRARQVDDIISLCDHPRLCINFGRFSESIQDVVKLIAGSVLVVAPDSSMVHIAAAQKVACVGIYGPFAAKCRTKHYPLCETIEPEESDCCEAGGRGCFRHAQTQCEYFERCWDNLDNEKLAALIHGKLEACDDTK